ncbi:MAG: hypothetical protein IJD16_07280 [Desulfovibrio sp.]|nr:hypothetical protein [Desulfovibrio sp.]
MKNLFNRILQLIEKVEKNSQTAFAKKIGWQQSTFNGYLNEEGQRKIRLTLIMDILRTYPTVSRDWLLWGEGEMFVEPKAAKKTAILQTDAPVQGESFAVDEAAVSRKEYEDLKKRLSEVEAELREADRLNRKLTTRLLIEGASDQAAVTNTGKVGEGHE